MKRWAAVLLMGCLVGCGQPAGNEASATGQDDAGAVPRKNVWSGELKAMDKARGVQQTLMDSAQRRRDEIDRQSAE